MKNYLRTHRNTRGIAIGMAAAMAVGVVILFTAIQYVVQQSSRANQIMMKQYRNVNIADSGLSETIARLRSNPDIDRTHLDNTGEDLYATDPTYTRWRLLNPMRRRHHIEPFIINDRNGHELGQYISRVKLITNWDRAFGPGRTVFHIATEGWSTKGNNPTHVTVHSYVELTNIAGFAMAFQGDLNLAEGSKLGDGKVYGSSVKINWDENNSLPVNRQKSEFKRALYYQTYEFDPYPISGRPPRGMVEIGGNDVADITDLDDYIERLPSPLVFPEINEELLYYKHSTEGFPSARRCDFTDLSELRSPGAQLPTPNPALKAYYCADPAGAVIGKRTFRGQIIIASEGPIQILGDLYGTNWEKGKNTTPGWDPVGEGRLNDGSTANQLILITRSNLVIGNSDDGDNRNDWCSNQLSPNAEIENNRLDLYGVYMIAPQGTIRVDRGMVAPGAANDWAPCNNTLNYKLKLVGGMVMAAQPSNFITVFKGNGGNGREYIYQPSLLPDAPPLRSAFTRHYEFELLDGGEFENGTFVP